MNTSLRLLCALLVVTCVSVPVAAQSVFHFPRVSVSEGGGVGGGDGRSSHVTVTNPSESTAEVEFELIGLDGSQVGAPANPVRYRVDPDSILSMGIDTVFATSGAAGWIRVSSNQSGLAARLQTGDFATSLEEIAPGIPLADQLVVIPSGDPQALRVLRVVNPSDSLTAVNVTVFDNQGNVAESFAVALEAFSGSDFSLVSSGAGARISSSQAVVAQVEISTDDSLLLLNGQAASGLAAAFRVAPHVVIGNGFESTLVLSNPTGQSITVFPTLFSQTGVPFRVSQRQPRQSLTIPANGSVSIGSRQLTGLLFVPAVNGWIEIESPNVPLAGALIVSQGRNRTIYPLQMASKRGVYYQQSGEFDSQFAGLVVTNLSGIAADVEISTIDEDGYTLARSSVVVAAESKLTQIVGELFPGIDLNRGGSLTVRSSSPVYGLLTVGGTDDFLAAAEPEMLSSGFSSDPVLRPQITSIEPEQVRPGDSVRIRGQNLDVNTLFLGGVPVSARSLAPGITTLVVVVPEIEAGFVDFKIRTSDGLESEPYTILVLPSDQQSLREVRGRAFFQKIDLEMDGLDLSQPVMVPIREARVDVFSQLTGDVFSVAGTDRYGNFRALVPVGSEYALRALSQSSESGVAVADNTSGGALYFVSAGIEVETAPVLLALDADRTSGAFNILEVIRQGNAFLRAMDSDLPVPTMGIFWSSNNTATAGDADQGQIGGTFFNAETNTAFILGDRATDSDEFDDSVILHEYAHLLATRFSRDDSRGGPHVLGDALDPRVAWSEGWANFFSALVRNSPIYRDSLGFGGEAVLEYNLEENVPIGDQPGYWSEFSVHSILWDLADSTPDTGDAIEIPLPVIWEAFLQLSDDTFVYVGSFLDRLTSLLPLEASGIGQITRMRSIDYVASALPSVPNPFPRLVGGTDTVTGDVDSLSRGRVNLAQSAHHYVFDVGGAAVSIRLDITGLGQGQNPNSNDLDLFLTDSRGRVLARSDRGLDGQSELISTFLPSGRYVIEIRSFYTQGETGALVFNSGSYSLQIRVP